MHSLGMTVFGSRTVRSSPFVSAARTAASQLSLLLNKHPNALLCRSILVVERDRAVIAVLVRSREHLRASLSKQQVFGHLAIPQCVPKCIGEVPGGAPRGRPADR